MTRVGDLAQHKLVRNLILDTQSRIADRQLEIASLQKSQDYAGISSDSHRLVTLEVSERRMDQFLTDNTFLDLRMSTMLDGIDALKTTITDVRGLMRDILDDGQLASGINKDQLADIKASEVEDFLNLQVNGRYLFGGSKTNVRPVVPGSMSSAPTFDSSNLTQAEPAFYYKGDDTILRARIDEGVVIEYGVTAAGPAYEKLIRGVRILRSTDVTGADANYIAKIQGALDLINESEIALQENELTVGAKVRQVSMTNNTIQSSKNFAQTMIADIENANTFEAVAALTQDQTMLEASYNVVVRLSKLSLNNFL